MADNQEPLPSLDEIQRRIDAIKPKDDEPEDSHGAAYAQGMRMAIDLFSGALVGGLIGYAIDSAFGTLPLFLIVFLLLGFSAGVRNVMRNMDKV